MITAQTLSGFFVQTFIKIRSEILPAHPEKKLVKPRYYLSVVLLLLFATVAFKAPSHELKIQLKLATTGEPMPYVAMWIVDTNIGSVADSLGEYSLLVTGPPDDTLCLMFRYWTANDTTVCLPLPQTDTTIIINYPDKSNRKNNSGWR